MKPIYLHIENFTSHKESEINFSGFSAALVIGKLDNNSLVSNGVGKTSIFRAIEYVLFNQTRDPITDKDLLLEDLILEDAKKCRVIFDFAIGNDIYRVVRARTDKGVADLSFFKRSAVCDDRNAHTTDIDKELWIDISSRTAQHTETDLIKTIRLNYKAFINTSHFMQFDFKSSLAAATPAHRKTILKEVLDLVRRHSKRYRQTSNKPIYVRQSSE
jgi:DNA repair exonuclease SbcCD ATPase subunit